MSGRRNRKETKVEGWRVGKYLEIICCHDWKEKILFNSLPPIDGGNNPTERHLLRNRLLLGWFNQQRSKFQDEQRKKRKKRKKKKKRLIQMRAVSFLSFLLKWKKKKNKKERRTKRFLIWGFFHLDGVKLIDRVEMRRTKNSDKPIKERDWRKCWMPCTRFVLVYLLDFTEVWQDQCRSRG